MSEAGRGLPLLSGPAPAPPSNVAQSDACRKCGKEFNVIFNRSRKCNHCGYQFCHSCTDYQALMPRQNPGSAGYDLMAVCGYCIEYLTITAAGKAQLKSQPLAKLKKYANAYGIRISHAVEKEDVIEAIVNAKGSNGCLKPEHETWYRRHSVPAADQRPGFRNMFRSQPTTPPQPPPPPPRETRPPSFPRPDLAPDPPFYGAPPNPPPRPQDPYSNAYAQPQQQYQHPPHPPPPSRAEANWGQYPAQHNYPYHTNVYPTYNPHHRQQAPHQHPHSYPQQHQPQPPPPPPQSSRPQPPPPQQGQAPPPPPHPQASSSQPTSRPPPAAPPALNELLEMTTEAVGRLSISTLKSILFANHVNAGQVLEKGELVKKVLELIDDERRERERQRLALEMEEMEQLQREQERREEQERIRREREERLERNRQAMQEDHAADNATGSGATPEMPQAGLSPQPTDEHPESHHTPSQPPKPSSPGPKTPPRPVVSSLDRGGLCVVCQDEEANIAIVDCGHMAMCRGCSDLIMNSSRECPLCRTRIVTEARLLRIFKS